MIIGITGSIGAGKSTVLEKTATLLHDRGVMPAGILSARVCQDGQRIGYDLLELDTGQRRCLARTASPEEVLDPDHWVRFFHFKFSREALGLGKQAIRRGFGKDCLFIDEIGFWELEGGGWGELLPEAALQDSPHRVLLLGLRLEVVPVLEGALGIRIHELVTAIPDRLEPLAEELAQRVIGHVRRRNS